MTTTGAERPLSDIIEEHRQYQEQLRSIEERISDAKLRILAIMDAQHVQSIACGDDWVEVRCRPRSDYYDRTRLGDLLHELRHGFPEIALRLEACRRQSTRPRNVVIGRRGE